LIDDLIDDLMFMCVWFWHNYLIIWLLLNL